MSKSIFKKFVGAMLVAVVLCGVVGANAQGYDSERDFQIQPLWEDTNSVIIIGYVGRNTNVNIPPTIQGKPVRAIGFSTESGCDDGDCGGFVVGAFAGKRLSRVIIPSSVTRIYEDAFIANNLTSITIGANVELAEEEDETGHGGGPSFDRNFINAYNRNGKRAGTYVLRNGNWISETSQQEVIQATREALQTALRSHEPYTSAGCETQKNDRCALIMFQLAATYVAESTQAHATQNLSLFYQRLSMAEQLYLLILDEYPSSPFAQQIRQAMLPPLQNRR